MTAQLPSLTLGTRPLFSDQLWLRNRNWDLTFISLSVILVPFPFLVYYLAAGLGFDADASRNIVNGVVALLIGGPHMYATYTRTWLDGSFRRAHPLFTASSLIIPIVVVFLATKAFILLLTIFFFWASVHVLHQIVFLLEVYNRKDPTHPPLWSRLTDYAVTFTSLYPIAAYKLCVTDNFIIGQNQIHLPDLLRQPIFFYLASLAFGISLVLWVAKSVREYQEGKLHIPKTLLIGLTAIVAFILPGTDYLLPGNMGNLDTAFQGFNSWHSFQYLGLTWFANRLRMDKGEISTPLIESISKREKGWKYYLFNVACTFGAILIIGVLLLFRSSLGLNFDQCYYMTILSFLWMHYYFDHFLFTNPEAVIA